MEPDSQGDIPESQKQPQGEPKRRNYRWAIYIAAGTVLVIAGYFVGRHNQANNNVQSGLAQTQTVPNTSGAVKDNSLANTWKGRINPKALPLGDGKVSDTPKAGYIDSCTLNFRGGGAMHAGNWINQTNGTWNTKSKVAVSGSITWPAADYSITVDGNSRVLRTDDLPEKDPTGIFPISQSDPAFQFDRNPNRIVQQTFSYTLPLNPKAAGSPSCTGLGPIGVLSNGVLLFNGLDAAGRDAVAHETQDKCNGHPDGNERYHYHDVAVCIRDRAKGSSTLAGYALDGYGIYVEKDKSGNLPTNADLDECHGRVSKVMWNGKLTDIYHYDATLEYPYTVGCYHGSPVQPGPGH